MLVDLHVLLLGRKRKTSWWISGVTLFGSATRGRSIRRSTWLHCWRLRTTPYPGHTAWSGSWESFARFFSALKRRIQAPRAEPSSYGLSPKEGSFLKKSSKTHWPFLSKSRSPEAKPPSAPPRPPTVRRRFGTSSSTAHATTLWRWAETWWNAYRRGR